MGFWDKEDFENNMINLDNIVNKEFLKILDNSNYPHKVNALEEINEVISSIEVFIKYPYLMGKRIVGLLNGDNILRDRYLNDIIGFEKEENEVLINNFIPIMYNNSKEEKIVIFNKVNNEIIENNEFKIIYKTLEEKYKSNNKEKLESILVQGKCKYENVNFIDFNIFTLKDENYKPLLKSTELLIYNISKDTNIDMTLSFLEEIGYSEKILIVPRDIESTELLSNKRTMEIINKSKFSVLVKNVEKLESFLHSYDVKVKNLNYFKDRVSMILLNLKAYHFKIVEQNKKEIEKIDNYLILSKDDENKDIIEIKNKLLIEIENNKEVIKYLGSIYNRIYIELTNIVENMKNNYCKLNNSKYNDINRVREDAYEIEYNILNYLIDLDEMKNVDVIINNMINNGFYRAHILRVKVALKRNVKIPLETIKYIRDYIGNNIEILRAKVNYGKALGVPKDEIIKICTNLPTIESKEEFYIMGMYYESLNDYEKAKTNYKLALEKGKSEAGDKLFSLFNDEFVKGNLENIKKYYKELEYLGKWMNPKANYALGCMYLDEEKTTEALLHLKLSAIYDNLDAIIELGNRYFKNKNYKGATSMYVRGIELGCEDKEVFSKLGQAYYHDEKYKYAYEILSKLDDPSACYFVGHICEYGKERMKDLKEALIWYERSKELGSCQAKKKCRHISKEINIEEKKEKYESSHKRREYSIYQGSNDDGGSVSSWFKKIFSK